jgi:hypothetical protein
MIDLRLLRRSAFSDKDADVDALVVATLWRLHRSV